VLLLDRVASMPRIGKRRGAMQVMQLYSHYHSGTTRMNPEPEFARPVMDVSLDPAETSAGLPS
jgi:hypothetical protein